MTTPDGVFVHPRRVPESDQVGRGTRGWACTQVPAALAGGDTPKAVPTG